MIIRCDRCDTEFSLDESQMREGGTAVRCSVCSHVFTAHPPDPRDIAHRPWQIRSEDGTLFSAKNLRVVANWISEDRLTPNDEISRTGHRWRKLSEIPEFQALLGLDNAPGIQVIKQSETLPPPPLSAKATPAAASSSALVDEHAKTLMSSQKQVSSSTAVPAPPISKKTGSLPPPPAPAEPKLEVPKSRALERRPDPAPVQGAIQPSVVPTQAESELALDALRADVKTLRSTKFGATPPSDLPRMSASLQRVATQQAEPTVPSQAPQAPKASTSSAAQEVAAESSASSGLGQGFQIPTSLSQSAQASRRRSLRIAGISAGAAALVTGLLWWQSGKEPGDAGGPKGAAVVQNEAEPRPSDQASQTRAALQAMDPAALRRMEAELHQQMQREDLGFDARVQSKFLLIELLTERALQLSLAATLTDKDAQILLDAARSDVMRARTLFEADPFKEIDEVRRNVVQLRLEFAEGRPLGELGHLLPASGAKATRALLGAASLWRDAHDPVAPATIAGLERALASLGESKTESMLLREALAVAQLRSGQRDAARRWATQRLEHAGSDPVARRIQEVALLQEEVQQGTGGGVAMGDTQTAPRGESSQAVPVPLGANASADALMNRGCSLVERGASSAGIRLLNLALEKEPKDLDIMLCLAQGYARSGDQQKSLLFFERILLQSPRHRSALYGAATQAAAQGNHSKATAHYRTLLEVQPGHGPAEAYLEVHGGS